MYLSPNEIAQLAGLIRASTQGYVITHLGREFASITPDEFAQLKASGLVLTTEIDAFKQAFKTGYLTAWQQPQNKYGGFTTVGMVNKQWGQAVKQGMPSLSPVEEAALFHAKAKAAIHMQGLGNTYANDFSVMTIETDHETRKQLQQATAEQVSDAIVNRETSKRLASMIGDSFGDWSRDLRRVAETELQDAHQHGWAGYVHKVAGSEAMVAKIVNPDACKTCRGLYVDADGKPKLFSLAELESNGSNFGLKRSEWKATVGPAHPFCYCVLTQVPEGFEFNELGQMVRA